MKAVLQKLLGSRPPERQRDALRKRAIERILIDEGLPRRRVARATARIFEAVLHDERR